LLFRYTVYRWREPKNRNPRSILSIERGTLECRSDPLVQYFIYFISGPFRDSDGKQLFAVKLAFDLLASQVLEFEHGTGGSVHYLTYFEYLGSVILIATFREFHLLFADAHVLAHPKF